MTNQRIVYENLDTGIVVLIPAPQALQSMTIEEIAAKDVPEGVEYKIIDADKIPEDRYFRDAWKLNEKSVSVDLQKARKVKMANIRALRDKKLKELDIETMKGNDVQPQKQVLRDLPDTLDLTQITSVEALKEFVPDELK